MSAEKMSFPWAEVTLGLEFNECSIAAAELNKHVATLFETSKPESTSLYIMEPEGVMNQRVQILWATDGLVDSSGRFVHLAQRSYERTRNMA